MYSRTRSMLIGATLGLTFLAGASSANADITATPKRLVFSPKSPREQKLTLLNSGREQQTYRVGFIHYLQTASKGFVEITRPTDAPEVKWADKMLRISPKTIVLPPGIAQTIRVQAQVPSNLPPGEYRTHLLLTEIPAPQPPPALNANQAAGRRARVAVTTVYRVALPILIWRGTPQSDLKISDLSFTPKNDGTGKARFTLRRSGDRSVFGAINIELLPYRETEPVHVATLTELPVYHPNAATDFQVDLSIPAPYRGKKGRLVFTFLDAHATPQIRDEQSIEIY